MEKINIIVVGGYGVIGQLFCKMVRNKHKFINIFIGSYNIEKANQFADELNSMYPNGDNESGKCSSILIDAKSKNPLKDIDSKNIKFSCLVSLINDPENYLLDDCCSREIPFLDIAKTGDAIVEALKLVDNYKSSGKNVRALWGSEWFVGLPSIVSVDMSKQFEIVDSIDIISLMKNADKSGPDSVEAFAGISKPYDAWINGKSVKYNSFAEWIPVTYPEGFKGYAYNFDNVETFSLPKVTSTQNVRFFLSIDDNVSLPMLKFFCKVGIMGLLSRPNFYNVRKTLFHTSGNGASSDVILRVKGKVNSTDQESKIIETRLHSKKGQAHFTSLGTLIAFEYLVGLNGYEQPPIGNSFPDWNKNISKVIDDAKKSEIEFFTSN